MLPTPSPGDLLKTLFGSKVHDGKTAAAPWIRRGDAVHWLVRSAWSLQAIADWHHSFHPERPVRCWVPDLFCSQSLAGLRGGEKELLFYPVDDELRPDWEACRRMAKAGPPDVFVLVHYFGIPSDTTVAGDFCGKQRAVLVEDCAHVLLPSKAVGATGDFVLFSPHKHLAIPDGALLLARPKVMLKLGGLVEEFEASFDPVLKSLSACAPSPWHWLIRRLLVRFLPDRFSSGRLESPPLFGLAPSGIAGCAGQSQLSRRLLAREMTQMEARGWQRFVNASALAKTIDSGEVKLIGPEMNAGFPYLLGLRFATAEAAEKHRLQIRRSGCPVITWPDLPAEIEVDLERHSVAIQTRKRTIFLPVHQDLPVQRFIRRMGRADVLNCPELGAARINWDLPETEWRDCFLTSPCSHLVQSSVYAVARAENSKWSPRYGSVEINGDRCAVFSVLERKSAGGLITAARMNRGPIWISQNLDPAIRLAAIRAIAHHYRWQRGSILSSALNLEMDTDSVVGLMRLGLQRRPARPWSSVWWDLDEDEEKLLSQLDGKWRNQLRAAERNQVSIEAGESDIAFEWMLERHAELMQERGFSGPAPALVRRLRVGCETEGHGFYTLRASEAGEVVAVIAIVRHGTSATYLLGWNGPVGRKVNANNMLLWNAALFLKRQGCQWFDLGGTDPWRTRGITEFKRGTKGREYRLVGEYASLGTR